MKPEIEYQKEFAESYLLEQEKNLFGFYLSYHPTTNYKKDNPYCIPLNMVDNYFDKTVDVLILVEKIKVINTKKGDKMAFMTGSDETSSKEFTLFPMTFKKYPNIDKGMLIKVRGHVERRLDEIQIVVEKVKDLKGESNES